MASGVYNVGKSYFFDNDMSGAGGGGTELWLLLTQAASVTFNADRTNVTGVVTTDSNTEATFTNYTTNGIRLSVGGSEGAVTLSTAEDDTADESELRADVDITWATAGNGTNNTIYGALLYAAAVAATPNKTNDTPLVLYDFGGGITTNSGDLTFAWGQEGGQRIVVKLT
jgi:hypothetical protein